LTWRTEKGTKKRAYERGLGVSLRITKHIKVTSAISHSIFKVRRETKRKRTRKENGFTKEEYSSGNSEQSVGRTTGKRLKALAKKTVYGTF